MLQKIQSSIVFKLLPPTNTQCNSLVVLSRPSWCSNLEAQDREILHFSCNLVLFQYLCGRSALQFYAVIFRRRKSFQNTFETLPVERIRTYCYMIGSKTALIVGFLLNKIIANLEQPRKEGTKSREGVVDFIARFLRCPLSGSVARGSRLSRRSFVSRKGFFPPAGCTVLPAAPPRPFLSHSVWEMGKGSLGAAPAVGSSNEGSSDVWNVVQNSGWSFLLIFFCFTTQKKNTRYADKK